jgi:hypothetical protein
MLHKTREMIIIFLSAFCSFNSGDILLLSVVLPVILRENQASKIYTKIQHYYITYLLLCLLINNSLPQAVLLPLVPHGTVFLVALLNILIFKTQPPAQLVLLS